MAIILLVTCCAGAYLHAQVQGIGALEEGTVQEVTSDSIKLKSEQGTIRFKVSEELLTNTDRPEHDFGFSSKFTEVKKNGRIEILYVNRGGDLICYLIKVIIEPTEEERQKEKDKKREQEKGDFNFGQTGDKGG